VNEGLMLIDMDYGWMRAEEVTVELSPADRETAVELTDRITVARDRAWFAEELLWRAEDPGAGDLAPLRGLKP